MNSLKDRLRADLTTAIKARDDVRSSTIRMILTAVTNAEVAGKVSKELTDDEMLSVLSTEAKKRREAAVAFEEGNRPEMAAKERAEALVIGDYLPAQLSPAEISDIVTAAVEQLGAAGAGPKAMGKVMGARPAAGQGPGRRRRGRGRGTPPARLGRVPADVSGSAVAAPAVAVPIADAPPPSSPPSPSPPPSLFLGGFGFFGGVPSEM